MGSLGKIATQQIENKGTDDIFLLAPSKTSNQKGGTLKTYAATTAQPFPCFYEEFSPSGPAIEALKAEKRVPLLFRRFTLSAQIEVTTEMRMRLVARAPVPEIEMEIIHAAPGNGIVRRVITVEELKQS